MSFPYRDETKELNAETREIAEGSFISLPNGVTHYELSNAQEDSTVVLVHGFSVPYFVYNPTFKSLTESGFRVLRYDLFGRGFSDRPHARYTIDLFVQQLLDLLDALRIIQPVNLIGLSMGGPITATFTTRHPGRIKSLTLIDPSGARAISLPPMLKVAKLPFIAKTILSLSGSESLVKGMANDLFDPTLVDHFIKQYRVQMQYKGFKRAILSSLRNNTLGSFIETYRTIGKLNKPVLLFWGKNDMTVPFEYSNDMRAAIPHMEFHAIENCGHIPHYEKPDEVNPILLEFLRKQ